MLAANPDEAAFVLVEAVGHLRANGLSMPRDLAIAVDSHLASERLDESTRPLADNGPT